jgi:hypothetical protein
MRLSAPALTFSLMAATTVRALIEESDDGLTMVAPTSVLAPRPDVLDLDLGDGLILYDPERSLVHHLNASAAEIWRRCDGRRPVSAVATDLAVKYGVPMEQMGKQVRLAIWRFDSLGVVRETSPEGSPRPSTTKDGTTQAPNGRKMLDRWKLIRRTSVTAGTAGWVVPIIRTVAATPA